MLLRENLHKISNEFINFEMFAIPAIKSTANITKGRPSGGISFLWANELNGVITRVKSESKLF